MRGLARPARSAPRMRTGPEIIVTAVAAATVDFSSNGPLAHPWGIYAWVLGISAVCGFVSARGRNDDRIKIVVQSILVGVLAFFGGVYWGLDANLIAVLVGVCALAAADLIAYSRLFLHKRAQALGFIDPPAESNADEREPPGERP